MSYSLTKSSSPHIRKNYGKDKIIYMVLLALLPAIIASIYFFKMKAFSIILVSIITAIVIDNICQYITNQKLGFFNPSSILTGILLALTLSPNVPLFMPVVGVGVAIILGKYIFLFYLQFLQLE